MIQSPFFTMEEAAAYLRFPSPDACRKWLKRRKIPTEKRGPRMTLVRRVSLDEELKRQQKRGR